MSNKVVLNLMGKNCLSHRLYFVASLVAIACLVAVQYSGILKINANLRLRVTWPLAPQLKESTIQKTLASTKELVFVGSSNFLHLLRKEYERKIANPSPHCIPTSGDVDIQKTVRRFNRAVEVDWVGRNISSVTPTWSSNETGSCHFAALKFPPTPATLDEAVKEITYHSSFYTAAQCESRNWDLHLMDTCHGNNWGGTLGSMSKESCIKESSWGYPVQLWAQKHLSGEHPESGPLQCIEILLDYDGSTLAEASFSLDKLHSLAGSIDKEGFVTKLMSLDYTMGFGTTTDWNLLIFKEYVREVLNSSLGNSSTREHAPDTLKHIEDGLKQDHVSKCVEELIPFSRNDAGEDAIEIHQYRYWKKYGVHLEVSSMQHSASSILKSLPGSLRNVLPPPPTAIYAINAILSKAIHVPSEAYIPGCGPYWYALNGNDHVALLSDEQKLLNWTSFNFREEVLHICSTNQTKCPFPTYDLVLSVEQVYCGGFFHFMIEIWGRIAPFLDALLAKDMPKFSIRTGCSAKFHEGFYFDLMGLNKERVSLLGDETVFAKEVIMPTEGFSHSPLFNYWNLVAIRKYVRQKFDDVIEKDHNTLNKTVIVIMRDAGRRKDADFYTEQFLQLLDEGLPNYYVTAHRASDKDLMSCLRCQVKAFMNADVIIGSHGAGLSHILFAKGGAVILERIVSKLDSGIYAEIPYMLGMKYFPMEATAGADAYRDVILFADAY